MESSRKDLRRNGSFSLLLVSLAVGFLSYFFFLHAIESAPAKSPNESPASATARIPDGGFFMAAPVLQETAGAQP